MVIRKKEKKRQLKEEKEGNDTFMGIRRSEKREKEKEKVGFTVGGCRASSIDNE